ncbi:MAG: prepilin-type N-terminal cleavage/methylation domain-containing protein, partial [Proteobacteria bacterium]
MHEVFVKSEKGFSLIELLVTISIASIVILGVNSLL